MVSRLKIWGWESDSDEWGQSTVEARADDSARGINAALDALNDPNDPAYAPWGVVEGEDKVGSTRVIHVKGSDHRDGLDCLIVVGATSKADADKAVRASKYAKVYTANTASVGEALLDGKMSVREAVAMS